MKWDMEFCVNNFNIKYTLDSGQCFRWKSLFEDEENKAYEYIGVIEDRVIKVRQEQNKFYIVSNKKENLKEVIYDYFDLNKDYTLLEEKIRNIDSNVNKAVEFSTGMHMLNQPVFETIISYIISANNNIKRISGSVNQIAEMFGKKVIFENEEYYLFPTLEELSKATEEDMLTCKVGFRARYIIHMVRDLMEDASILKEYKNMLLEDLRNKLLQYMGIGPKVADCIMLFSMRRYECFPVDVWVKRIMEKLYFRKNTDNKEIINFAKDSFKEDAGLIQQHLFYNVRMQNM